jgi:hypothetical protein
VLILGDRVVYDYLGPGEIKLGDRRTERFAIAASIRINCSMGHIESVSEKITQLKGRWICGRVDKDEIIPQNQARVVEISVRPERNDAIIQ